MYNDAGGIPNMYLIAGWGELAVPCSKHDAITNRIQENSIVPLLAEYRRTVGNERQTTHIKRNQTLVELLVNIAFRGNIAFNEDIELKYLFCTHSPHSNEKQEHIYTISGYVNQKQCCNHYGQRMLN